MSPAKCAGGCTAGKGSRNRPKTRPRLADGERIRQGSTETGHKRRFCPKLFATDDARCPVKFYKALENNTGQRK